VLLRVEPDAVPMRNTTHPLGATHSARLKGTANRTPRPPRTTLSLAALAALTLAGCGGSNSDSAGDDPEQAADVGAGELVIDENAAGAASTDETPQTEPEVDTLGSSDEVDPSEEEQAIPTTDLSDEERALAFAECMREEGVSSWPDPATNSDGSIDLSGGGAVGLGPTSEVALSSDEVQVAIQACGPLIAGASFLPNNGAGMTTETQDQFVDFAQCLRDEGVDVSDPDLSDGAAGLLDWDFDPDDPANAAAIEVCQTLFAGAGGG
jgi:hypothetical protein